MLRFTVVLDSSLMRHMQLSDLKDMYRLGGLSEPSLLSASVVYFLTACTHRYELSLRTGSLVLFKTI